MDGIAVLDAQDCAVTAFDIEDRLRRDGATAGRASVYRALEQLEELGLLRRPDVSRGVASYERIEPDGHHHHHAICRECGRAVPFEDASLERAIDRVSGRMDFEDAEHEVVIRGRCERCAA
jgi:Fur family transcriptional regulator, ferric uptake regulator